MTGSPAALCSADPVPVPLRNGEGRYGMGTTPDAGGARPIVRFLSHCERA